MNIRERLIAARNRASNGGIPIRRKDAALYSLLSECLGICEDVLRDGLLPELREAIRVSVDIRGANNAGKGRRYAETTSDAYILVARAVLSDVDNRNSVYRYAVTLREAGKRQIRSADLVQWLTDNGGVRALYLARPLDACDASTKTLHLNSAVEYPKSGTFTLTLRWDGIGFFDVIK